MGEFLQTNMSTRSMRPRATPTRVARENGVDEQVVLALENRADLSSHFFVPHASTLTRSKRIAAKLGIAASPLRDINQKENQRETPMIERVGKMKKKMTRGISRDTLMNDVHDAPVMRPSSSRAVKSSGISKASVGITKAKPEPRPKRKKKAASLKSRQWQKDAAKIRAAGDREAAAQIKEAEKTQGEVMGLLFYEEIVEVDDEVSFRKSK